LIVANAPSKLEPYRQFIAAERKRGTTYRRLVDLLAEKGMKVDQSTIYSFVKVRSKPQRRVVTMLDSEPAITTHADATTAQDHTGTSRNPEHADAKLEAIRRLKNAKPASGKRQKGLESFRPDMPLERHTEKEARRLRDDLHR
jgi:hypothetical protein